MDMYGHKHSNLPQKTVIVAIEPSTSRRRLEFCVASDDSGPSRGGSLTAGAFLS